MSLPVLIACAHGTASQQGQLRINELRAEIAAKHPDLVVLEAYVDVQEPSLVDVVAGLPEGTEAVVVPLLLTTGYHVQHDIAQAVASRPGLLAAQPLGPDAGLVRLLDERIGEVPADWGIVLAAAGSSVPAASLATEQLAKDLAAFRGAEGRVATSVQAAYGASATPSVPQAVASFRAEGAAGVVLASYLLAPGYFHDQLALATADAVTRPLLPAPVIAEIAYQRYLDALNGGTLKSESSKSDAPAALRFT